jgi:hypothetical protein
VPPIKGRKGFENRIIAVITIVNPILTKMALTLRLLLPECRLAHLKAPTTTAGAYSNTLKDTALQEVQQSQIQYEFLGKSWSFKNNSNCLSFSFKRVYNLILKVE